MVHEIKCVQPYFNDICNGIKNFDLRINDRNYQVGDELILKDYDPATDKFSGNTVHRTIGYILIRFPGLRPCYCIIGFQPTQIPHGHGQTEAEMMSEWPKS